MIAARIKQRLESDVVRLPNVGPLIGKNVEIIVIEDEDGGKTEAPPRRRRVPGLAKGIIKTGPDIDAPLPDGVVEDFYK